MHYAAALQGTTGGLNQLYTVLSEGGADENVVDVVSFINFNSFITSLLKYTRYNKYKGRGKCNERFASGLAMSLPTFVLDLKTKLFCEGHNMITLLYFTARSYPSLL